MDAILSVVSTVAIGLLVLSVLVMVHELGHMLAAWSCGVRVTEFFLGMPSRLRLSHRSRKYGTVVGVTPILLGGYTRICGMEGEPDERLAAAFACVMRHGRVDVGRIAQEVGCETDDAYALCATLTDWAAIEPYYDPELGEREGQRDWPQAFQTVERDEHGLTIYDVACDRGPGAQMAPAGSSHEVADPDAALAAERSHTYLGCGFAKRLWMLVAGPLFNLVLAVALVVVSFSAIGYDAVVDSNAIGYVEPGSLADGAGLEAGDEVTSIGGEDVTDWQTLSSAIDDAFATGEPFELSWTRDGEEMSATVTPGADDDVLGVRATTEHRRLGVLDSVRYSFVAAWQVVTYVVRLIVPTHTLEVLDSSTSVVGIAVMSSRAAAVGVQELLLLMASVSMSLCFMNLLPIPPLDGGKILVEAIGALRRRPLSAKAQTAVSYLGLAFFMFVFVYVLRLDILRFFVG